jgi:hypothetical protein
MYIGTLLYSYGGTYICIRIQNLHYNKKGKQKLKLLGLNF